MKPDELMGRWISFLADAGSVGLRVPVPGRARVCGEVIGVKPMDPAPPSTVPTACVKVRGRTGAVMDIDFSACFGFVHESQADAIAAVKVPRTILPPVRRMAHLGALPDGGEVWRLSDGSALITAPHTERQTTPASDPRKQ